MGDCPAARPAAILGGGTGIPGAGCLTRQSFTQQTLADPHPTLAIPGTGRSSPEQDGREVFPSGERWERPEHMLRLRKRSQAVWLEDRERIHGEDSTSSIHL